VRGQIDLKIRFYLIPCLTISDSRNILFYCLLCACVCLYVRLFNPAFGGQNTISVMLNWLRISCVVFITIASTWHTNSEFLGWLRTTYHRQGNKRVEKRFWGCVKAERQHSRHVLCVTFDTEKHFIIPIETLFV